MGLSRPSFSLPPSPPALVEVEIFFEGEAVIPALSSSASGEASCQRLGAGPVIRDSSVVCNRSPERLPDSFPGRIPQLLPVPIAFSVLPDSSKALALSGGEEDDG